MILQIQKYMKKAALILTILTVFLSLNAYTLEDERCERALARCLLDSILNIPFFSRVYTDMAYCLNGWVFCEKYVDEQDEAD